MEPITAMKITGITLNNFRNHTETTHFAFGDLSYISKIKHYAAAQIRFAGKGDFSRSFFGGSDTRRFPINIKRCKNVNPRRFL